MSAPRKLPAIAASLAIIAMATVAFFPALFGGKILAPLDITKTLLAPWSGNANGAKPHNHNPSDAVTQYLPYRIFTEKSLKEDGYIGWNPYEMGGYSLAGNTMALPSSWTTQLHRFLPFKDAWNLGIVGEFLIAGIGMLAFLRSRKLPWLACLIGAIAYMANSQFIIWIYHRWALGSFCWMPWVLWSAVGTFQWSKLTIRQLLLPGFLALALLGGSLQHIVFVFLACACLFLGSIRNLRSAHQSWPTFIMWAVAFSLAAFLTAFSLYPQINAYLENITLGHVRGGIGYPNGPSQVIFNALLIPVQIWPWLMGDPQTIDGFKLLKSGFMDLAYLGTIPMLLAVVGLFHKSMPRQAKWLILAGLLIPLTPLVGPLYHRVQLLFLLGAAWMAAEMLAQLPAIAPRRFIRRLSLAVIALGAALLVGACLPAKVRNVIDHQVVTKSLAASAASQFGADKAWIEQRARNWTARFSIANPRTAWVYGLLLVGTAGLTLSSQKNPVPRKWGNVAILGATSLELFTLFQTWTTFSDPRDLLPTHPAIEMVRTAAGTHRVLQASPGVGFADMFATPNVLSAYAIPSVDAYESIQYRSSLIALAQESPQARFTLAGVGVSVQPASTPVQPGTESWPVTSSLSGYTIRQNPAVPAPLSSGTGPTPVKTEEILAALKTATSITPTLQTMNRWTIAVPDGSTWLRIAQNWHSGWRWKTAGQNDWHIFDQGPDATCWIDQLPSNAKQIEVRFFPRPPWLSLTSLCVLAAWLCLIPAILLVRRKKSISA
jgi:hypothetical protein